MKFEITTEENARIHDWLHGEVYPTLIKEQKKDRRLKRSPFVESCWEDGYPYLGAVGGGLTYHFSPNSIGTVIKVSFLDRFTLDLTDYESW